MSRRRIAFMASDPIALPALEWSLTPEADLELVAVFTQPDRAVGRGKKLTPNVIKVWAQEKGIPVLQPERLSTQTKDWMLAERIELTLVMAYGHFLKQSLLDAPTYGTLNLHGSILPQFRGASPVEAALIAGLDATGISLMRLVKQMDAGPVMDVEHVSIEPSDTAPSLRKRVGAACPALLKRSLPKLFAGEAVFTDQDPSQVSYVRKLFKTDGFIDFSLSAVEVERRARAFFPWPGGATRVGDDVIKMESLSIGHGEASVPGTIIAHANGIGFQCGEGAIFPAKMQRPGGKMLPVKDFLNGYPLEPGTVASFEPSAPIITAEPYVYK